MKIYNQRMKRISEIEGLEQILFWNLHEYPKNMIPGVIDEMTEDAFSRLVTQSIDDLETGNHPW